MIEPTEIRAARKAYHLTQEKAAALLYVTKRCWQKWEAGERPMHRAFWELFHRKAAKSL
jgi:DNA (cytosine-5)-methyltransferase 1